MRFDRLFTRSAPPLKKLSERPLRALGPLLRTHPVSPGPSGEPVPAANVRWFWRETQPLSSFAGETGSVVYQHCSGETHYISEVMVALLERLQKESATSVELLDDLLESAEPTQRATAQARVLRVLQRLEELGLVANAPVPVEGT